MSKRLPICLLFLCALSAPIAAAQPASEPLGYRDAVDDAVREFRSGNFLEARALFEHAHGLFPNARTFRGIGMSEFELRNYAACTVALTSALDSRVRPLEGALRKDTEGLLARAVTFVTRLDVANLPPDATLRVDGEIPVVTSDRHVLLAAGDHVVELKAPGIVEERHRIAARGGNTLSLPFKLQPSQPQLSTQESPRGGPYAEQGIAEAAKRQSAEGPEVEPPGYLALLLEGDREFSVKNYTKASELFTSAHQLFPNARTRRRLGLVEYHLGNYPVAVRRLTAALKSTIRPLTPDQRAECERVLQHATTFTARVGLKTKPKTTQALVDGVLTPIQDDGSILISQGRHAIELQADGFASERRELTLEARETRQLELKFSRKETPPVR